MRANTTSLGAEPINRRIGYGAMQLAGSGVFGPPRDPMTPTSPSSIASDDGRGITVIRRGRFTRGGAIVHAVDESRKDPGARG